MKDHNKYISKQLGIYMVFTICVKSSYDTLILIECNFWYLNFHKESDSTWTILLFVIIVHTVKYFIKYLCGIIHVPYEDCMVVLNNKKQMMAFSFRIKLML